MGLYWQKQESSDVHSGVTVNPNWPAATYSWDIHDGQGLFVSWLDYKVLVSTGDVPVPRYVLWELAEEIFLLCAKLSWQQSDLYPLNHPLTHFFFSARLTLLEKLRLEHSCLSHINFYWWDLELERSFCSPNDAMGKLHNTTLFFPEYVALKDTGM